MNVYIVQDHDYESDEILGVFATREAAESAKAARGDLERLPPYSRERSAAVAWSSADIHEWSVLA